MAAQNTDFFQEVGNPGTATSLAAPGHSIAGTTFNVTSTANWPTTTGVTFAVDQFDTVTNKRVPGSYTEWEGVVSSSTVISNATLRYGTDQNYSAGSTTRVYIPVASSRENRLVQGVQIQHKQDGSHSAITADSVTVATGKITTTTAGKLEDAAIPLTTYRSEMAFDYVASGCVITATGAGTTLGWSMTAGVVYIGGKRLTVTSASGTVTASKDTYFDLLDPGTGTVATLVNTSGNIVANNAASPALAASSVRIGIVVSGATNIAAASSINQGQETMVLPIISSVALSVTDSLGNLICPRDPNRKILGYKQTSSSYSSASTTQAQVTGLSCPIIVPTGRKVKVTVGGGNISNSAVGAWSGGIWDGTVLAGTLLQTTTGYMPVAGTGNYYGVEATTTPTSTSKTYNFGLSVNTGTGILSFSSSQPGFIRVELA